MIGAEWPLSDFEDSGGAASGSWNKLSPGATVRVEYFLTPKASGPYAPLSATVTYKVSYEADAKTQVSLYGEATAAQAPCIADQTCQAASVDAGCLRRNPKSLHPLPNTKANEDSPQCGKPYVFANTLACIVDNRVECSCIAAKYLCTVCRAATCLLEWCKLQSSGCGPDQLLEVLLPC